MTALEKAKAAIAAAKEHEPGTVAWADLIAIARISADISQAESLDRIAHALTARVQ